MLEFKKQEASVDVIDTETGEICAELCKYYNTPYVLGELNDEYYLEEEDLRQIANKLKELNQESDECDSWRPSA